MPLVHLIVYLVLHLNDDTSRVAPTHRATSAREKKDSADVHKDVLENNDHIAIKFAIASKTFLVVWSQTKVEVRNAKGTPFPTMADEMGDSGRLGSQLNEECVSLSSRETDLHRYSSPECEQPLNVVPVGLIKAPRGRDDLSKSIQVRRIFVTGEALHCTALIFIRAVDMDPIGGGPTPSSTKS